MSEGNDKRVLVLAPGRDRELTCEILKRTGIHCVSCVDYVQLRNEIALGAGAVLCAEEALSAPVRHEIKATLDAQPAWSDLPVIVVASNEDFGDRLVALSRLRSVSVLGRPMAIDTLVTAVKSALQARSRQYEVRNLLIQREEAAQRKDEFLAMLAHELRNPLAPIRFCMETLRVECGPEHPKMSRAIALVDRQVAHMARLIDDLLDVSRISSGVIALKLECIDFNQLLGSVADSHSEVVRSKALQISFEDAGQPLWVNGDAVRLTQVLDNLVDNSQKFSKPSSHIRLGARIEKDQAVAWVSDNGQGFDPTKSELLFETFSQADRSLDRSKGGLGMGLPIAQRLMKLHHGEISAWSAGVDQGATFTLRLPLAEPVDVASRKLPAAQVLDSPGRLKVLVVEDNRDAADLLCMMLKLYGHDTEVAYTGPDGLEAAKLFRPDVMLCDIGLPGMSGYEIAKALRTAPTRPSRLIAITGYGGHQDKRAALDAGFDAHLVKPVNPGELLEEMKKSSTAAGQNLIHS